jgi:hypothetical protein
MSFKLLAVTFLFIWISDIEPQGIYGFFDWELEKYNGYALNELAMAPVLVLGE